jgi:hypothetical protein
MFKLRLLAGAALLVGALAVVPAAPVAARDGDVIRTGSCSGATDWKLKAGHRDGRIEVEFEVDSNRNGQTWRVRILDNSVLRYSGLRVTKAPSGSFSVERRIRNMAGSDRIVARARNLASGEVCVGRVTI